MKLNKGFTLIELLVVIAIIGILSSVVLASLNTARSKGADAAAKSDLNGIRAQAELLYDDSGSCYGDGTDCASGATTAALCTTTADTIFADTNVSTAIDGAETATGGLSSCASTADQSAYAIAVQLKSDDTTAWCIDSTGQSGEVSTGTTTAYTQTTLNAEVAGGVCVNL